MSGTVRSIITMFGSFDYEGDTGIFTDLRGDNPRTVIQLDERARRELNYTLTMFNQSFPCEDEDTPDTKPHRQRERDMNGNAEDRILYNAMTQALRDALAAVDADRVT